MDDLKEEASFNENEIDFSINLFEPREESSTSQSKSKSKITLEEQSKEVSETQIYTKILEFPFNLDTYMLIKLKDEQDPELGGKCSKIILGDINLLKFNEYILKLVFLSKDKISPLNLDDYQDEIKTLSNILDIKFISVFKNILFIQCDSENSTNEAYISLQKSSPIFELLYEEEPSNNCIDGNKILDNPESLNQQKIVSEKIDSKVKKFNKFDVPFYNQSEKNNKVDCNIISDENILENTQNKINNLKISNEDNKYNFSQKRTNSNYQNNPKPSPPIYMPPNNYNKMSYVNPSLLLMNLPKISPPLLHAVIIMQNLIKFQQANMLNQQNQINPNNINLNLKDPNSLKNIPSINIYNNINFPNCNFGLYNNMNNVKQYPFDNPNNIKSNITTTSKEDTSLHKENTSKSNKESNVEFHTNSTRDYQFKYVSRYIVQIENEKNFPVTKMIIGNNGKLLRKILLENCINFGDNTTKIRLRGRGSGYKEGPKNEESKDPMELCISSLNYISYCRCSMAIENLLLQIYSQYYIYQCNNLKNEDKEKKVVNPVMKKILKYTYIVNRFNTLVKEEKKRKKEEELKQSNQNESINENTDYNV